MCNSSQSWMFTITTFIQFRRMKAIIKSIKWTKPVEGTWCAQIKSHHLYKQSESCSHQLRKCTLYSVYKDKSSIGVRDSFTEIKCKSNVIKWFNCNDSSVFSVSYVTCDFCWILSAKRLLPRCLITNHLIWNKIAKEERAAM